MADEKLEELRALLARVSERWAGVTQRKMFGCNAFFADKTIFGLIWKTGRIGLKLPERDSYDAVMGLDGAQPWTAGKRTMSHWVLVPPAFHDDPATLQHWAKIAHRLARRAARGKTKAR